MSPRSSHGPQIQGFPEAAALESPLPELVDVLDAHRAHSPPSAVALKGHADRLIQIRTAYRVCYEARFVEILGLVGEGKVSMIGRTGQHPASPVVRVEPTYCLGQVTIGHTWSDLGPTVSDDDRPPAPGSRSQRQAFRRYAALRADGG